MVTLRDPGSGSDPGEMPTLKHHLNYFIKMAIITVLALAPFLGAPEFLGILYQNYKEVALASEEFRLGFLRFVLDFRVSLSHISRTEISGRSESQQ